MAGFYSAVDKQPKLNFKVVSTLADIFHSSQTATAIRLVEGDHSPALLVCHGHQGRKWFTRGPEVPERWFPRDTLDADSFAFGVFYGGKPDGSLPRKIGAEAWFDHWEAANHEVHEQTIRTSGNEILTLVLISDPRMLRDHDDRSGRRYPAAFGGMINSLPYRYVRKQLEFFARSRQANSFQEVRFRRYKENH